MKKKVILGTIAAIAVSSAVIHGISKADSQQTSGMSDVTLANVEALSSEIGDLCGGCSTNCYGQYCCTIIWGSNGPGFALNRCD